MKHLKLKSVLFILVGMSVLFGWLIFLIQGTKELDFLTTLKLIPKVVTADGLVIAGFTTYLWKFRIFKGWLTPFPNLNGTWKGHIQTTWVDPKTGKRPGPIPAILTIRQSFFRTSCVMRTAEMTSRSSMCDFVIDPDNQIKQLCYSYDSNPKQTVQDRSPQHCGTQSFNIVDFPKRKLIGNYWTGRNTSGHIEMTFWKKSHLDEYPTELGEHPVSAARQDA